MDMEGEVDRPGNDRDDSRADVQIMPDQRPSPRPARQPSRLPLALGLLGAIFGAGALGFSGWSYFDSQREVLRLASEVAQLRVSLDLYARGDAPAESASDADALNMLGERLSTLEQSVQGLSVPDPVAAAAPAVPAMPEAGGEDCLPEGMRLLVAAGDNYPICGQPAVVEVSEVQNGFIVLSDGTAVASGGTMALPESACTIGVTSGGDEGLTGYAEIRVTC